MLNVRLLVDEDSIGSLAGDLNFSVCATMINASWLSGSLNCNIIVTNKMVRFHCSTFYSRLYLYYSFFCIRVLGIRKIYNVMR